MPAKVLFNKLLTIINISLYNIQYKCNDYQLALILVLNLINTLMKLYFKDNIFINYYQFITNSFTSKI